jgi:hypothetical protein
LTIGPPCGKTVDLYAPDLRPGLDTAPAEAARHLGTKLEEQSLRFVVEYDLHRIADAETTAGRQDQCIAIAWGDVSRIACARGGQLNTQRAQGRSTRVTKA